MKLRFWRKTLVSFIKCDKIASLNLTKCDKMGLQNLTKCGKMGLQNLTKCDYNRGKSIIIKESENEA